LIDPAVAYRRRAILPPSQQISTYSLIDKKTTVIMLPTTMTAMQTMRIMRMSTSDYSHLLRL
jgi:hypothetical protein